MSEQAKYYKEIILDHKNAIETGETTFENYRTFVGFESKVYQARIDNMDL